MEAVFRYNSPPQEAQMRAISGVSEVYGIRSIVFDEKQRTVCVGYDGSRLSEPTVVSLLRGAGLDVQEKVASVSQGA